MAKARKDVQTNPSDLIVNNLKPLKKSPEQRYKSSQWGTSA